MDVVRHSLTTTRPTTFHVCKTRGCQCSFRLLMMGGMSPETCRASYKYGIIKFWYIVASCWIFLYEDQTHVGVMTKCTWTYNYNSDWLVLSYELFINARTWITLIQIWLFPEPSTLIRVNSFNSFLLKCQNRIYNTKNNNMQAIIKIVNLNGGETLVTYAYVGEQ